MMDNYHLYLLIALITVASPGPGVILTLSNAIRYGVRSALSGMFGIASGIFMISILSATSLGILLASSALAFTILKYIGAAYLIYLGIKLWKAPAQTLQRAEILSGSKQQEQLGARFKEGFLITLLNPKPIFFFMSLFPQFIQHGQSYLQQFSILTITFCGLIILVHTFYTFSAYAIKDWLLTPKGSRIVNRIGGTVFVFFGIGLATSQK